MLQSNKHLKHKNGFIKNKASEPEPVISKSVERSYNGQPLDLTIIEHNTKELCLEFIIERHLGNGLKRSLFLSLLTAIVIASIAVSSVSSSWILTVVVLIVAIARVVKDDFTAVKESLLVTPSLGIQAEVFYKSGRSHIAFIPWNVVRDITVNEAISINRVIHYLILTKMENEGSSDIHSILPLFQCTWPNLRCIVKIYRILQTLVFQSHSV